MRFGQLKRREFITLVGGAAAWPVTARAAGRPHRRVGIAMPNPKGDTEYEIRVQALRQELARLGWTEGGNVQFDERWTTDNMDLVRANAASLVASNPDVVVATGGRVIPALMELSHTIPIVIPGVSDPVRVGYVQSLALAGRQCDRIYVFRPFDIPARWLETLETDRACHGSRCVRLQPRQSRSTVSLPRRRSRPPRVHWRSSRSSVPHSRD